MTDDDKLARYFATNYARWDESVAIHAASLGYDMDGFLRGEKTLYPVEMDEVGDVVRQDATASPVPLRYRYAQLGKAWRVSQAWTFPKRPSGRRDSSLSRSV